MTNMNIAFINQIYTTNEVRIGTWVDGKPLYRKVFLDDTTFLPQLNGLTVVEDVDCLITQTGIVRQKTVGADSSFQNFGFPFSSESEYVITKKTLDNELKLFVVGNWSIYILTAIFEYTKTTDEPENLSLISQVYSVNETRVGTWIDGKPLYRRVLEIDSKSATSVIGTLEDYIVPIRVESYIIDKVKDYYPADQLGNIWITEDNKITYNPNGDNRKNCPMIIILEYTKTTD